jgi:hypothetical protein
VVSAFPQSPAAQAFRAIASRLWERTQPDPSQDVDSTPQRLEA